MKKMKNNLDEMQELNLMNIEKNSFWIAYFGLVIAIVVQSFAGIGNPFGETIVLLIVSVYSVSASIKRGIWDRRIPATPKANLAVSLIGSAIFSVALIIGNYYQYGVLKAAVLAGVFFFVFITVVCFGVLTVLTHFYKKKKEKLEQEIEE